MAALATRWSRETFGDLAEPLAAAIVKSLTRAHERARTGHGGLNSQKLEAYGHGLYAAQFEELMVGLERFAEVMPVRLGARAFMVVADHLIYPLRYASKSLPVTAARLRRRNGLRAGLIRELGPEPMQGELDLGLEENPKALTSLAGRIPPDTRLLIVAYASSMSEGILRLEWGVAELHPEGSLRWHHHEPL